MAYITTTEGSDKNIGTQTQNTDEYLQRFSRDTYPVYFDNVLDSTNLNGAESFYIDCSDLDIVYFKIMFSVSNASASFRIKYYDSNDKYVYSDQTTITSTGHLESSWYLGNILQIDTLGFSKVVIRLDSAITNGGNVKISGGGLSGDVNVNKGYVFCGSDGTNYLKDTDEYNNQTNTWASKTNSPSPSRSYMAASTILNKGYIYCGSDGTNRLKDTDEYNPDTWTSKTDAPSPARDYLTASTILNKGYIINGLDSTPNNLKDTDEYNPDTWTSKTDTPSPAVYYPASFNILNKIYVSYGITYGSWVRQLQNNEYTSNIWTSKTAPPSPGRNHLGGTNILNKGYAFCGDDGTNNLKDCDEYNPDTWTSKTDAPSPGRREPGTSTILNKGYVFCGYDGTNRLKDCDEYNPDTWTSKTDAPSPARDYLTASTI